MVFTKSFIPFSPSTKPETAAAQEEIGAMIHTGAARSINEIRQLCPTYFVLIRYRSHHRTHGQAIKVIVNKNQAT